MMRKLFVELFSTSPRKNVEGSISLGERIRDKIKESSVNGCVLICGSAINIVEGGLDFLPGTKEFNYCPIGYPAFGAYNIFEIPVIEHILDKIEKPPKNIGLYTSLIALDDAWYGFLRDLTRVRSARGDMEPIKFIEDCGRWFPVIRLFNDDSWIDLGLNGNLVTVDEENSTVSISRLTENVDLKSIHEHPLFAKAKLPPADYEIPAEDLLCPAFKFRDLDTLLSRLREAREKILELTGG